MRDIQLVLERWGVWSRYRLEVDYSPIAAGFKGLLKQDPGKESCCDDDAMIVDSCMARLKQKRPDEHELIFEHYVKDLPKRAMARKRKTSEGMIRIKLQLAEGFIEGCLAILDVHLEMDSYTQKKNIIESDKKATALRIS